MSAPSPFVLPADLSLAVSDGKILIRHAGDVTLEQTLGRRLHRVDAGRNLTVRMSPIHGSLRCRGTLLAEGTLDAVELRGQVVQILGPTAKVRVVVAKERIEIGPGKVHIEVVSAPEVVIHPDATGRITILDCGHELPATRIRGCLTVAEYDEDVGGARRFLETRRVQPVGPYAAPPPAPAMAAAPMPAAQDALPVSAVEDDLPVEVTEEHPPVVEVSLDDEPEPTEITAAPAAPRRRPAPSAAALAKVRKSLQRIQRGYSGAPPPGPVTEVIELIDAGDLSTLADRIDGLWSDVLREHLQRGSRPARTVIQGFHGLYAAVQAS